jgi:hypothetical protein
VQFHEIIDFMFFHKLSSPWPLIFDFFPWKLAINICTLRCTTAINDIGHKLTTGVVDTGGFVKQVGNKDNSNRLPTSQIANLVKIYL